MAGNRGSWRWLLYCALATVALARSPAAASTPLMGSDAPESLAMDPEEWRIVVYRDEPPKGGEDTRQFWDQAFSRLSAAVEKLEGVEKATPSDFPGDEEELADLLRRTAAYMARTSGGKKPWDRPYVWRFGVTAPPFAALKLPDGTGCSVGKGSLAVRPKAGALPVAGVAGIEQAWEVAVPAAVPPRLDANGQMAVVLELGGGNVSTHKVFVRTELAPQVVPLIEIKKLSLRFSSPKLRTWVPRLLAGLKVADVTLGEAKTPILFLPCSVIPGPGMPESLGIAFPTLARGNYYCRSTNNRAPGDDGTISPATYVEGGKLVKAEWIRCKEMAKEDYLRSFVADERSEEQERIERGGYRHFWQAIRAPEEKAFNALVIGKTEHDRYIARLRYWDEQQAAFVVRDFDLTDKGVEGNPVMEAFREWVKQEYEKAERAGGGTTP